jgi:flagellar biogenesis protein FliO
MLLSITAAMVISSARAALMREDTLNDIDNICSIITICVGLVFIIAFISISVWLIKLFMGK